MWILLAILSALSLGVYDIFKKVSVVKNNVLSVLFWNTAFCALLMSPFIIKDVVNGAPIFYGRPEAHLYILLKSAIVLASWTLGYFSMKHLPLTITGPIGASRPVIVLMGAMLIFGERLNFMQSIGVALGFFSLFYISKLGKKESTGIAGSTLYLWLAIGSTIFGAISGLYDKYLLKQYEPLQVQAWYGLYQTIIMGITMLIIKKVHPAANSAKFTWKWSILGIAVFLTVADMAYFYALSSPDAMISIVSMIRRGSVLVSFLYGIVILKEQNVKAKLIDLGVLLIALTLLVFASI
jgi:transporter family protein